MQIYFHLLWSENKFTDFFVFPNFADPTRNVNYKGKQNSEKIQSQDKTQSENTLRKSDY